MENVYSRLIRTVEDLNLASEDETSRFRNIISNDEECITLDNETSKRHYTRGNNPNSKKNLKSGNIGNKGSSGKRYIHDKYGNNSKIGKDDPLPKGMFEGRSSKYYFDDANRKGELANSLVSKCINSPNDS